MYFSKLARKKSEQPLKRSREGGCKSVLTKDAVDKKHELIWPAVELIVTEPRYYIRRRCIVGLESFSYMKKSLAVEIVRFWGKLRILL